MPAAVRLNHRVRLEHKVSTRNDIGDDLVSWCEYAEVWAAVEPIRGREFFAAAQVQSSIDVRVTIRYRDDVVREDRIAWGDQLLDIVSVIDVGGRGRMLELMCVAGVRNGR